MTLIYSTNLFLINSGLNPELARKPNQRNQFNLKFINETSTTFMLNMIVIFPGSCTF